MSDLQRDIAEIEAALEKVHIYQREDCKRLEAAWQRLRARLTPDQERVAALEGYVPVSMLVEAREQVESWGAYAAPYFTDKWDLAGTLAKMDAQIAAALTDEETSHD